jgi:hypothetical protein
MSGVTHGKPPYGRVVQEVVKFNARGQRCEKSAVKIHRVRGDFYRHASRLDQPPLINTVVS